ncbi:MAG: hypothetical protein Q9193_005739, partial [Seirophora villosa]
MSKPRLMVNWVTLGFGVCDQDDGIDMVPFILDQTFHQGTIGGANILLASTLDGCHTKAQGNFTARDSSVFRSRAVGSLEIGVGLFLTV